ncbi:MAG: 50S ribosomal protein L25 [Bacteroidetes bacterium]|nr:50S ribosomal protein L25 [Bacteroidota bacterium]
MKKVELLGTARESKGTTGATQLRRSKKIPCVLYGGNGTVHFSVEESALSKVVHTPESYRIELDIDGQKRMALLHQKQFHPVSDKLLHVDFLEMNDAKEARVSLSVRLKGQAAGVRKGGKLNQTMRKLRVKGLPTALPEHIEVDITDLDLGHSIRVADLKFPGISLVEKPTDVVVSVKMAKKEEAAAAATAAGASAPAAGAKAAEAAKPAAGAAKPAAKK